MWNIEPEKLVLINAWEEAHSLRVEIAYARDDNLLFGERIYRENAGLWLYEDLANVVKGAAKILTARALRLIVYDGLRTMDAQGKMLETQRVKDNPHWLEAPRLLSPSGAGGHPRGMAVDVSVETLDGVLLDMGTPFDYLAADSSPEANPAHRDYQHGQKIAANRKILDDAMTGAAKELGVLLLPLPQEWWDFRLPEAIYGKYAPLSDADLPPEMRMCD